MLVHLHTLIQIVLVFRDSEQYSIFTSMTEIRASQKKKPVTSYDDELPIHLTEIETAHNHIH